MSCACAGGSSRTSASRSARPSVRCRGGSGASAPWATRPSARTSSCASRPSSTCCAARAGPRRAGAGVEAARAHYAAAGAVSLRVDDSLGARGHRPGMSYPRDLVGYGQHPPDPKWPGGARLALQIVMNYEEGGERSILHGDGESEAFLQEVVSMQPLAGVRNLQVESMYEYGSRVGFWRLMRIFAERGLPISVFAVGMALERHPEAARGHRGRRSRGGQSRLSLDRLPVRRRGRRARTREAGRGEHHPGHGEPTARLVHRPARPEHAAPGGRGGRIPLRRRRLQRRPALLGGRGGPAASRGPVHAGQQRHEVRVGLRLRHRRRVARLRARRLRRPLRRGRPTIRR